jgi:hypothetical protein
MYVSLKIIWRTQKDESVCPVCRELDGYTWSVDIGEPYPKQLIHPLFGPVYDNRPAAAGSLVNEEKGHMCRCTIERQFDVFPPDNNTNGKSNDEKKQ